MEHGSGLFRKESEEEEVGEWVLEGVEGGEWQEGGQKVGR